MKVYESANIRNIALVGHQGAGCCQADDSRADDDGVASLHRRADGTAPSRLE